MLAGKAVEVTKLWREIGAAGITLPTLYCVDGVLGSSLSDPVVDPDTGQVLQQGGQLIPFDRDMEALLRPIVAAHDPTPDPPPPSRDEKLIAALSAPKAALVQASSLDEVKVIFASALDGLVDVIRAMP